MTHDKRMILLAKVKLNLLSTTYWEGFKAYPNLDSQSRSSVC
jgi:hypothetical protein